MKILKQGKAHMHKAWFTTCRTCESELRILEGDPLASPRVCFNCDASQYYIRYVCPICGAHEEAHTSSSFGVKANARYETIILNREDREEMANWADQRNKVTGDDLEWIENRNRI